MNAFPIRVEQFDVRLQQWAPIASFKSLTDGKIFIRERAKICGNPFQFRIQLDVGFSRLTDDFHLSNIKNCIQSIKYQLSQMKQSDETIGDTNNARLHTCRLYLESIGRSLDAINETPNEMPKEDVTDSKTTQLEFLNPLCEEINF